LLLCAQPALAGPLLMAAGRGASPPAACGDPGDITSNTKLLVHSNNPDGSIAIVDSSSSANPITVDGSTNHDSAQAYFGASAIRFSGDDNLSLDRDICDFGQNDFTIEALVRLDSVSGTHAIVDCRDGGTQGVQLMWSSASSLGFLFQVDMGASVYAAYTGLGSYAANTWYHVAGVLNGTTLTIYVNGTAGATTDTTADESLNCDATELNIGNRNSLDYDFDGWIDELVIWDGTAKYTSGFTSPTEPYSSTCYPLDGYQYQADLRINEDTDDYFDATITNGTVAVRMSASAGNDSTDVSDFIDWACGTHDTSDLMNNIAVTDGTDEYSQHYIESVFLDCTNEIATLYFLEASISDTVDSSWKLYYGGYFPNSEWVGNINWNAAVSVNVWPNNVGVWHFNGATATDNLDSSEFGNDVSSDTATPDYQQAGQVDYAVNLTRASKEELIVTDDNSLSFGDGSTDSEFSIFSVIYPEDASRFRPATKFYPSGGGGEYIQTTTAADRSYNYIYDNSTGAYRFDSPTTTFSNNTWVSMTTTYDASGLDSGLYSYKNDTQLSQSGTSSGSYTAMENGTTNLSFGSCNTCGGVFGDTANYTEGMIDEVWIFDKELIASEVTLFHHGAFDSLLDITAHSGDASPKWLKISNADLLNEQFEDLTGWSTTESGSGVYTQTTYEGFEVHSVKVGTPTGGSDYAAGIQDIGSFSGRVVCSWRLYPVVLGTLAAADYVSLELYGATDRLPIYLTTGGIYTNNSGQVLASSATANETCSGSEVGCWQKYMVDADFSAQTFDLWLDGVEIVTGQAFEDNSAVGSGNVRLVSRGETVTNVGAYWDNIKCGTTLLNE
jgi:hypothetical protein